MSEVRVFELAKELNMPAKQLLAKVRKAGIPVTGNFSELSSDQAELVRKMAKSAKGIVLSKSSKTPEKAKTQKSIADRNMIKLAVQGSALFSNLFFFLV